MATFYQPGETLDYTNSGDSKISAGAVVVYGARIGIAACDIAVGDTGALHMVGVFELPKKDETAIDAGVDVYWNPSSTAGVTTSADNGAQTPTAYVKVGYCAYAAAAADTTVLCKINA